MKCTKCNGYGYIDNLEGDGIKCPKCGGTGFVPTNVFGVNGAIKCDFCDGTGVFITNAVEPMTNEEWFCGLSTEDKAKWIAYQIYYATKCDVHNENRKNWSVTDWEMWLKEKHDGSV